MSNLFSFIIIFLWQTHCTTYINQSIDTTEFPHNCQHFWFYYQFILTTNWNIRNLSRCLYTSTDYYLADSSFLWKSQCWKIQVREEAGTHSDLQIKISTNADQKHCTLNGFFHGYVTGNTNFYSSYEIINSWNRKITRIVGILHHIEQLKL